MACLDNDNDDDDNHNYQRDRPNQPTTLYLFNINHMPDSPSRFFPTWYAQPSILEQQNQYL
jgi:hypothetical protein